jgi:hypothetical protein
MRRPAGHGEPGGAGTARAASAWLHAKLPRGCLACGNAMVVNSTRAGSVRQNEVLYIRGCSATAKVRRFRQCFRAFRCGARFTCVCNSECGSGPAAAAPKAHVLDGVADETPCCASRFDPPLTGCEQGGIAHASPAAAIAFLHEGFASTQTAFEEFVPSCGPPSAVSAATNFSSSLHSRSSMAKTNYRWEARRIDGFLAQLIRYVASGHYFYVTGRIPVARVRRTRVFPPHRPQPDRPVRHRQAPLGQSPPPARGYGRHPLPAAQPLLPLDRHARQARPLHRPRHHHPRHPPPSPASRRLCRPLHLLRTRETLEGLRTPGPRDLRQPTSPHARPGHPNEPPVPGSTGARIPPTPLATLRTRPPTTGHDCQSSESPTTLRRVRFNKTAHDAAIHCFRVAKSCPKASMLGSTPACSRYSICSENGP